MPFDIHKKEGYTVSVVSWCPDIEVSAQEQIDHMASLPFTFHHVALAPDCHMGFGCVIGGIMATDGVVLPACVGSDIGCGVLAQRTNLTEIGQDELKKIMGIIRQLVPVGFNKHTTPQHQYMADAASLYIAGREYENAALSIGTLGGGNHFIEIQKGSDGFVWVMLHSGSRNLGKQVADYYNKIAVDLNAKWHSSVPKDWELAFLPLDTDEAQAYIEEMLYCVDFAAANRTKMLEHIKEAFSSVVGVEFIVDSVVHVPHNYAAMEHHYGEDVMVHRKGATRARKGELGLIPGSQGSHSYVVRGLGNPLSFESCSHGAGRAMGRKQAQRSLVLEAEIKRLDDLGVVHSIRSTKDLDEAAGAYKDISEVMANQSDLVEIVVELSPLAVIKG